MYQVILHATDLNKEHYHISKKAKEIADAFHGKLYLLHVMELPTSIQIAQSLGFAELAKPVKDDAITVMQLLGESLEIPEDQQFVEIGSVRDQILTKAKQLSCDLIILGNHTHNSIAGITGNNVHAALRLAPCDVTIIKP